MTKCEILDFGEEAVKDVETKLKILKFDYSWADEVEKHERRMQEAQKHIRKQKKAKTKPQKLTSGDQNNNTALTSPTSEPPTSMIDCNSISDQTDN